MYIRKLPITVNSECGSVKQITLLGIFKSLDILTSCKFMIVCPKSSATLLKNVNIDVLINSGQFFTRDLASIPFTSTWRHLTVIRTSGPNAASLYRL